MVGTCHYMFVPPHTECTTLAVSPLWTMGVRWLWFVNVGSMIVATQTTLLWDADGMLPAAGGCVYVVGGKSLLAAQCCCEPSTALNKQTSAAWIWPEDHGWLQLSSWISCVNITKWLVCLNVPSPLILNCLCWRCSLSLSDFPFPNFTGLQTPSKYRSNMWSLPLLSPGGFR